eukprot:UC1_evm1s145
MTVAVADGATATTGRYERSGRLNRSRTLREYAAFLDAAKIGSPERSNEGSGSENNAKINSRHHHYRSVIHDDATISRCSDSSTLTGTLASQTTTTTATGAANDTMSLALQLLLSSAAAGRVLLVECILRQGLCAPGPPPRVRMWSPLHAAAAAGHAHVVEALLEHGALVTVTTGGTRKATPAHYASSAVKTDPQATALTALIVSPLVVAGNDRKNDRTPIGVRDAAKQSLLHWAARAGHVRAIEVILARQGDDGMDLLNARDRWFRAPVHWAALNGHVDALKLLLKYGADPNTHVSPRSYKRTHLVQAPALHLALGAHNSAKTAATMAYELLVAGANPCAHDGCGLTPLDVIRDRTLGKKDTKSEMSTLDSVDNVAAGDKAGRAGAVETDKAEEEEESERRLEALLREAVSRASRK